MIIGLTGKRLAGKDTAGAYLVEKYGFERVSFADALKEGVAALFGIPREQVDWLKGDRGDNSEGATVTVRYGESELTFTWVEFLQRFGTQMGRITWGEDFWVNMALPSERRDKEGTWHASYLGRKIVCTDVRFDNEAKRIIAIGGRIVRIQRPNVIDTKHDVHESEAGLSDEWVTHTILNHYSLDYLYTQLDLVVEKMAYADS